MWKSFWSPYSAYYKVVFWCILCDVIQESLEEESNTECITASAVNKIFLAELYTKIIGGTEDLNLPTSYSNLKSQPC